MGYTNTEIKVIKQFIKKNTISQNDLEKKLTNKYYISVISSLYQNGLIKDDNIYVPGKGCVPTGTISIFDLNNCKDIVKRYNQNIIDKWFTRGIAVLALLISIIALLKP